MFLFLVKTLIVLGATFGAGMAFLVVAESSVLNNGLYQYSGDDDELGNMRVLNTRTGTVCQLHIPSKYKSCFNLQPEPTEPLQGTKKDIPPPPGWQGRPQ